MSTNAGSIDWKRLARLDRESLNYITGKMQERYGATLTLLEIEEAILDAFGTHVRVATHGRELGAIALSFADIGVPEESARARDVHAPRMDLLPKETMDRIGACFTHARENLPRYGVKLPTHSFVWVPLTEWTGARDALEEVRAQVAEIVERELLDNYTELREEWRAKAAEKGLESYRSLLDAGVVIEIPREEFVTTYIRRILGAFPTYEEIRSGIDVFYETRRPSSVELINAVIAFRDEHLEAIARERDLATVKAREQEARRAMLLERAQIWRSQAEQTSLLSELAREAGAEILKVALPFGDGLIELTSGSVRKLKNEIVRWLEVGGALVSTPGLDERMQLVLTELVLDPKKRNLHRLRVWARELAEELTRIGQPHPLYAASGEGILDVADMVLTVEVQRVGEAGGVLRTNEPEGITASSNGGKERAS